MIIMKKSKVTDGSLFAGAGGIRKGFENAGASLVWANEMDKNAIITYKENFSHKLIEGDIHDFTDKDKIKIFDDVDIITSGFPCQAFSIAGYRKGFDDPRGNLFFETAKIIEKIRPKAYLLENVKNLVTHDNGKTFEIIRDTMVNKLNYSFIPFILNSKDYGDVPQTRERIYVIGFKNEAKHENFSEKNGIYNFRNDKLYREELKERGITGIKTLDFRIPKPKILRKRIEDILENKIEEEYFYYTNKSKYFNQFEEEVASKDTIYQWRRVYLRENKNKLCPTLTANMGTGGHNVPIIKDDYGIRKLTPLECFRFQGFPKDYILPGIARSHLYKQAGNSVTVSVIERIAKEILKVL